jgi:hypothetical protein
MAALPKLFLLVVVLALLATGCETATESRTPEQVRRPVNESDIRQNILGTWSAERREGDSGLESMRFTPDGVVEFQRHGLPVGQLAWRIEGGVLVVTPEKDALVSNSLQWWIVWRIDDHELVFRRGISTAGPPERYVK